MEHTRFLPATTPTRALLRRLRNRSSLVPSISSNFPLASPPPPASTSTKTSSMAPATRSATKTATRGTKARPATSTGNESPCVERQQRGGGGGGAGAGPRLTWEAARKLESEFEAQEKILQGLQRDNEAKTIEVEHLRREARTMSNFLSSQYGEHWEKIVFGSTQRRPSTAASSTSVTTPKKASAMTRKAKLPDFLLREEDDGLARSQSSSRAPRTTPSNSPVKPDDTRSVTLFWDSNDASFVSANEERSMTPSSVSSTTANSLTPRQVVTPTKRDDHDEAGATATAAGEATSIFPIDATTTMGAAGETDTSFLLSRFLSCHRQSSGQHQKQQQQQQPPPHHQQQLPSRAAGGRGDAEVQDISALLLSASISSVAPLAGVASPAATNTFSSPLAFNPAALRAQVESTRALVETLMEGNDARLKELRAMAARTTEEGDRKVDEMRALVGVVA